MILFELQYITLQHVNKHTVCRFTCTFDTNVILTNTCNIRSTLYSYQILFRLSFHFMKDYILYYMSSVYTLQHCQCKLIYLKSGTSCLWNFFSLAKVLPKVTGGGGAYDLYYSWPLEGEQSSHVSTFILCI